LVEYLFWAGAGLLLGLILAGDYILTRFRHTDKSRRTLATEAAGSLLFVAAVVLIGFRVPLGWVALLWVLSIALPVFLCVAVGTVEVWRRRKLSAYDGIIRQLRRDLQKRRDDLDRLIWQTRDLERRTRASAREAPGGGSQPLSRDGEVARLRREVEAWQGAGGLARIRALKVEEWRAEAQAQASGGLALATRRRELEAALREAADERREALRVQIALIRLQELEADRGEEGAPAASAGPPPADVGLEAVRRRRSDEEREVARLQAELDQWQRERAAFLRQRIPLD
jgi:hypothetical protein